MTPDHIRAHRHAAHHREEVLASELCGCFYCVSIFPPDAIEEWVDHEDTAACPECTIDSVIGSESGYPITEEFLKTMRAHWFEPWLMFDGGII